MASLQRRVTLAVCLIVGLSLLMTAGLTFLVSPMSEALGLGDEAVEDILAIPSVAALIAVFTAGQLGDRFGHRRALVCAAITFSVGSAILAIANGGFVVELGLAICAAAAITLQIVGVSLLQHVTVEGRAQVSAFTTYGAIFPVAFLALPVATAGILGLVNWRIVPIIWVGAGVIILLLALSMLESDAPTRPTAEWSTPILAGIALAGFGRAFAEVGQFHVDPQAITIGLVVGLAAAGTCLILMRRRPNAGLSFTPIASVLMRGLLIGVGLVSLVGLLTFLSITLEYFYDMTPFEASLAMIPAQVGAIVGAKVLASRSIHRWGGLRASRYLMLGIAIPVLGLVAVQASTPAWYLVSIATLCSCAGMAALTVLNTEVMRRAPRQSTGAVSAFRTAISSLGGALGVGIFGTIIISSVQVDAGEAEVTTAQLSELAFRLQVVGVLASLIAASGWLMLRHLGRRFPTLPAAPV